MSQTTQRLAVAGIDRGIQAQDDGISAEARLAAAERTSAIVVDVHHDGNTPRFVADVYYAATGRSVPRTRDEGGTHNDWLSAQVEGEQRRERALAWRV